MAKHDKRSFVEKVDFVSGVGYPGGMEGRRALGLSTDGPKYIFTPKCIFSFDEEGKIFVLSIHPHITKEELIESTGFDLGDLSGVPVTPAPTEEELYLLRNVVDPTGLLLGDFKSEVFQ
jgi:glutaconate CoA-transferase subunit B